MSIRAVEGDAAFQMKKKEIVEAARGRGTPIRSRSLTSSFGHAFAGLRYVLSTQRNARVHLSVALAVVVLGVALGLSWLEFAIISLAIALVFFAELVNTVTETVVDLITYEHHPLAKAAKDIAAGAVLWTATGSVAIGFLIIVPHLLRILGFRLP